MNNLCEGPQDSRTSKPLATFCKYLKKNRKKAGIETQTEMAKRLSENMGVKISRQSVIFYERGKRAYFEPELLKAISEVCQVSYAEVVAFFATEKYGVRLVPCDQPPQITEHIPLREIILDADRMSF